MKIGIFGGTFNPPHLAHLNIAEDFSRRLNFDKLIIIPTYQPPHKQAQSLADGEDRLEMCRLLFDAENTEISDMEIRRQGKSYTYDTLCQLEEKYPEAELYLIIGSDMLLSFHKWYRYEDILRKCTLCVLTRENDIDNAHMKSYAIETLGLGEGDIVFSSLEPTVLSSTRIREMVARGEDVSSLTGEKVWAYIKEKRLYNV
ncbi:MAG: nicotinate (nicotinamide) nucleotide adenylyltransferase [Ruminococcaceae bacterium]|nr:nicotinate (nicotinamide) nucleotide adenylyltransferase [Oscillospiraceae bacterium]